MFSLFSRRKEPDNQQLRTPSPSIDSAEVGKANSPFAVQAPPITPSPPPENNDDLGLINDPKPLHTLIASVPPKVLHEYILSHLLPSTARRAQQTPFVPPSARTLTHLTSFFSSLTPPPKLHCVRCHKDYYDIDNSDRSCLVPHDDESAEVERVGRSKGTEYETLYGCCGKTVEGDGDMGPPDGWCYEGKHTTDPKRARFRADSTVHDDKLASCVRMRCHEPPSSPGSESSITSPRPRKKTARKPKSQPIPTEEAGEGSGHELDDDARSIASSKGKRKPPTTAKAPRKKRARKSADDKAYVQPKEEEEESDVEMEDATSKRPKAKKPRKSKPSAQPATDAVPATSHSTLTAAPGSPEHSSLSAKKSTVSYHPAVEVTMSKGAKGAKDDEPKAKRPKKVNEVISSSIDGEGW